MAKKAWLIMSRSSFLKEILEDEEFPNERAGLRVRQVQRRKSASTRGMLICTPLFQHSQSHCCIWNRLAQVFAHSAKNINCLSSFVRLVDCLATVRRDDETAEGTP